MITIQGDRQLDAKLLRLERNVGKKIVRKAVREGQRPTLAEAKANARSMIGGTMGALIAKNLQLRVPQKKRRGQYSIMVAMKRGVDEFVHITKAGRRIYIPAALEYGHGNAAPIPYMRNASDRTEPEKKNIVERELKRGIEAEAMR